MQALIAPGVRSHSVPRPSVPSWYVEGHERFQRLLEMGMEVRTHWAGERLWWKRVVYVPASEGPPAMVVEPSKTTTPQARHTVALVEIVRVGRAPGEARTIEIQHGHRLAGRSLSIELPTVRCALLFQQRLLALLCALGLLGSELPGENGGAAQPDCGTENGPQDGLLDRVAAQGYA